MLAKVVIDALVTGIQHDIRKAIVRDGTGLDSTNRTDRFFSVEESLWLNFYDRIVSWSKSAEFVITVLIGQCFSKEIAIRIEQLDRNIFDSNFPIRCIGTYVSTDAGRCDFAKVVFDSVIVSTQVDFRKPVIARRSDSCSTNVADRILAV